MFFRKKTTPAITYEWGLSVDIHNHILPGIDDGASDVPHSVSLLEGLHDLGFSHTIPTPHIASGLYLNDHSTIEGAYHQLKNECDTGEVNFLPESGKSPRTLVNMIGGYAAEYMLDDYFVNLITEGLVTYPNDSAKKYVLIEFPYMGLPHNWHQAIFKLRKNGYQPILAHPERYTFMKSSEFLEKFVDIGLLFQMNLLSLWGYYGKEVKANARFFLKERLYNFTGTDAHHSRHIAALKKMKQDREIADLITGYSFENGLLLPDLDGYSLEKVA